MDDYSISSLQESRNEWCSRLINILTPLVVEGFKSIFNDSVTLCKKNDELEKYLMTFQNFLERIPKWNTSIVEEETNRIITKSNCSYLNDLISCVHIIQLKSLTCMRVGNKQKKIDIDIPSLTNFIHKVYINCARKIYRNVYLFELNISPLSVQKHNRELELIIREEILNSIRENIPVENILKVYLDESVEESVDIEENEEIISTEPVEEEDTEETKEETKEENQESNNDIEVNTDLDEKNNINFSDNNDSNSDKQESIRFDHVDRAISIDNIISEISAPKTEERLEQISQERYEQRKLEEMEDDEDEDERITIGGKIDLSELNIESLESSNKNDLLGEIEILT